MRFGSTTRWGFRVLLLGPFTVLLAACAGIPIPNPASDTPTSGTFGVPPSIAAFCPSPDTLAPIVGEMMALDDTTFTHGSLTSCGYRGPTGDICGVTITALHHLPQR